MIITKKCHRCGKVKPYYDFYKNRSKKDGLQSQCKECLSETHKKWYKNNVDKARKSHKEWYNKNKEYASKTRKDYYYRNRDIILEKHKQYRKDHKEVYEEYRTKNKARIQQYKKEYQKKNKDKVRMWHKKYRESHKEQIAEYGRKYRENNKRKINKTHIDRLHKDPIYKMKEQTRNMVRYAFRSNNHKKDSKTKDIVGCDLDYLCKYLFETWKKRYGKPWNGEKYHIDHIVPLSTAKNTDDIKRLCHYTNLQLLTPEDNMQKSDKLDWS